MRCLVFAPLVPGTKSEGPGNMVPDGFDPKSNARNFEKLYGTVKFRSAQ